MEKLVTTLSFRLAILTTEVMGIVVLLDVNDLMSKSNKFCETARLFGTLLKKEIPQNNILYLFNDKFNLKKTKQVLINVIDNHLNSAKNRISKLYNTAKSIVFSKNLFDQEKDLPTLQF